MTPNNLKEWMNKASKEPYAAAVTLMELGSSFYDGCVDRKNGTITGPFINDCIACFRHLCSLDGHLHLEDFVTAIVAWFALLWQGKTDSRILELSSTSRY